MALSQPFISSVATFPHLLYNQNDILSLSSTRVHVSKVSLCLFVLKCWAGARIDVAGGACYQEGG